MNSTATPMMKHPIAASVNRLSVSTISTVNFLVDVGIVIDLEP